MKFVFKDNSVRPKLHVGDVIISSSGVPHMVLKLPGGKFGVMSLSKLFIIPGNTFDSLDLLLDWFIEMGELVRIIKAENIEIREV